VRFLSRSIGLGLALTCSVPAADRPTPSTLRSAFEAQFPKTDASAAALELERLAASLGIDLVPRQIADDRGREGPALETTGPTRFALKVDKARSRPSAEAETASLGIRAAVAPFLDRELKNTEERIGPPPPYLERYLEAHEAVLTAVESLLLREADVRWEMDVFRGASAPLPNLSGILQLQRVFVTRALLQARRGESEGALRTLDAAWRLNEVVSSRPELISQLIAVAAAKLHVGALRKLDGPAYGWADRLRSGSLYSAFLAAFQNQTWESPDVKDLTGEKGAFGRILRQVATEFQEGDLCSWTSEKLQETWSRAAQAESSEEAIVADIAAPNLLDGFLRWRRYLIDAELTALVLDARTECAAARGGKWPANLSRAGVGVCPKERWSYRASPNGTATFAFEGRITESSSPAFQLPFRFTAGDPSARAPRANQGFLTGADGVRLFYRRIGDGKRPLVFLHGGPGSNQNGVWPDLEPLAKAERSIVLYDQRGGGRSEILKNPAKLTAAHHVRDLEAVRAHFGFDRVTLVGESWGAGLAALYAGEHPARVERLVLIGPMPPTREILDRRLDESSETMGLRKRLAEFSKAMPDAADPIAVCRDFFSLYIRQFFLRPENVARRRGSSCNAPAEGVRNYFVVNKATFDSLGAFDLRPTLARLTMPAMVIEGERSIASTVESARVVAQSIPGARLLLVPEAGHFPQVERPDVFFPAVEEFLK
jgi:proline iminopeptidase